VSAPAGIPPAAVAVAIAAGAVTTSGLEHANVPSMRHKRRAMLCSELGGITFRSELRAAGWRKAQITHWLRTGEVPE
jgi:hypothetical protein